MDKKCGTCRWWDRSDGARLDTSFTRPQQLKSRCTNELSEHKGHWRLSLNDGKDCPVYVSSESLQNKIT